MRLAILALSLAGAAGCAQSSYQTARMLPQGGTRLSAALSSYSAYTSEGNSGKNAFEVMGSHGMNEKIELGGKLSYLDSGFSETGKFITLLAVPKVSLIDEELALAVPTGVLFNTAEGSDNAFETMPGVVYTRPLTPEFELDAAGQLVIATNDSFDELEVYPAGNLGVQFSPPGASWALHPELGVLIPTGEAADMLDYVVQFGIAFHYKLGAAAPVPTPPPAP